MKTNKSFTKRIKVTRNGKLVARKAGQGHFNAKEGGRSQMSKRRTASFLIKNKARSLFLKGSK